MILSSTTSNGPEDNIVLDARHIDVEYVMSSVRANTLKELVLAKLAGKLQSTKTNALKDVSLQARRGECVALIGHNGCGKSTFLKVMAGILKPVRGSIVTHGRIAPLIELGAGFDPELTGRENVYLSCSLMGLTRTEINERINVIRDFAELDAFFEQPVKTYSSGMYMRLGFACSTAIDADMLLIDEILAVGDENFQRKCFDKMTATRKSGVTIIIVSHDLGVVRQIADRVLVLEHGSVIFAGKPVEAIDFYHQRMEAEREAKRPLSEREEEARRLKLAANDLATTQPSGEARILETSILNADSWPTKTLEAGKPWTIAMDIRVTKAFRDPLTVGYAVHDLRGNRLFGGNTKVHMTRTGAPAPALTDIGHYAIRFDFDALSLATGEYVIVSALHDHRLERTIDIHGQAARFQVTDSDDLENFDHDLLSVSSRQAYVRLSTEA